MKSIGMARKVDDLGRIVLPIELRRLLGIQAGDDDGDLASTTSTILLHKIETRCVFCDGDGPRTYKAAKLVCVSRVGPQVPAQPHGLGDRARRRGAWARPGRRPPRPPPPSSGSAPASRRAGRPRCRRRRSAVAWPVAPPTTMTYSPRGSVPADAPAAPPSVPRHTSSCSLVSSRATATRRQGPHTRPGRRALAASRWGAS